MKLQQKGVEEVEQLKLSAEEEEIYIKTMSYMLTVEEKRQKQDVRAEYFAKLKEGERKASKLVMLLEGTLKNKISSIMENTKKFIKTYEHQTGERRKEHNALKTQDDALQVLLVSQLEKVRKACDYVKVLKVKLSDSQITLGRKLEEVREEDDFFSSVFSTLKDQLQVDRKKDLQQLIHVTVKYNQIVEHLEKFREKLKNILHMTEVCARLETQEEKVHPFPGNVPTYLPKVSVVPLDPELAGESAAMKEYIPAMELFWQRVAQANACRYSLNEEREYLRVENVMLKRKIYEYCQCLQCPVPEKNVLRTGVKNITEGALEKNKYDKQNCSQYESAYYFDIDE